MQSDLICYDVIPKDVFVGPMGYGGLFNHSFEHSPITKDSSSQKCLPIVQPLFNHSASHAQVQGCVPFHPV